MKEIAAVEQSLKSLREEFDRSFAVAPNPSIEKSEDLLVISVGGHRYGIRVKEISGIENDRRIVAVPSHTPFLLGLSVIRNALVSVFSLAAILGHQETSEPRWVLRAAGQAPLALAFNELERYQQLPASALRMHNEPQTAERYIDGVATTEFGALAIISIPRIVSASLSRFTHREEKEQ